MKIKYFFSTLLIAAIALVAFNSCSDVPEPYPIPTITVDEANGFGTLEAPYTIKGAQKNQEAQFAWVNAYIVGFVPAAGTNSDLSFTLSDAVFGTTCEIEGAKVPNSNIIIAATPDEKVPSKCMAVQLPSGDVRNALNLAENPDMLGVEVKLYGTMEKYFGSAGVKSVTTAIVGDKTIGELPEEPADAFFSEPFTTSLGQFTVKDVKPAEGLGEAVWVYSSQYKCAKATSYANGTSIATESWLVSPAIDLSTINEATLSFEHAGNYFNDMKTDVTLWIAEAGTEAGATGWTKLEIPVYPSNSGFDFVKSGDISLKSYIGKKVQIAFKYLCTTKAGTYELKNFMIEERVAEETVTPEEPTTPEGNSKENPFTVSEAIAAYSGTAVPKTWVKGYIVGVVDGMSLSDNSKFTATGITTKTNILIAESATETDATKCIPVQLPSGNVRNTLNLVENPGNLGKTVTLCGSIDKYFGAAGLKSPTTDFVLEGQTKPDENPDTPTTPEEKTTFTKVSSISDGTYLIVVNNNGSYKVAQNVAKDKNYGYLNVSDATVQNNEISMVSTGLTFKITSTANGYTIQGEDDRYYYMTGSYTSFNLSSEPTEGQYWDITANADGTFKILNKSKSKYVQYSNQYTSYGIYDTEKGIMPYLFKKN